jgi:phosphoribosylformylglycinamidine cyclo-ligase
MFRVFNMGVGMILVADAGDAESVVRELTSAGEESWILGEVVAREGVELV